MKLCFLGTGTSTGVPQIGCSCAVCRSENPHDKRLRTSALIENGNGTRILIDCGPDFRQQMLRQPFAALDGVLITHEHYDHVGGIDDLRPYSTFGDVNIYAEDDCLNHLKQRLPYCFTQTKYPGVPQLRLNEIHPNSPFSIKETPILPLRIMHGKLPILGYRIGDLTYLTDLTDIPNETLLQIQSTKILVVNGLRFEKHPTHQTIEEAIAFAQDIKADKTYITHLSHQAGLHDNLSKRMPSNIEIAYDGLTVTW